MQKAVFKLVRCDPLHRSCTMFSAASGVAWACVVLEGGVSTPTPTITMGVGLWSPQPAAGRVWLAARDGRRQGGVAHAVRGLGQRLHHRRHQGARSFASARAVLCGLCGPTPAPSSRKAAHSVTARGQAGQAGQADRPCQATPLGAGGCRALWPAGICQVLDHNAAGARHACTGVDLITGRRAVQAGQPADHGQQGRPQGQQAGVRGPGGRAPGERALPPGQGSLCAPAGRSGVRSGEWFCVLSFISAELGLDLWPDVVAQGALSPELRRVPQRGRRVERLVGVDPACGPPFSPDRS